MSEETTPEAEYATPDEAEFDISGWLTTGHTGRAKETLTVHQDPSLVAEAVRLQREAARLNEKAEAEPEDLAVGEKSAVSKAQAEIDALEERIRAQSAEVVIVALSDRECEDIAQQFKQRRPGDKRQWDQTLLGTCMGLAEAATFAGRKLTAQQWMDLSEGVLAGGQWETLKQKQILAQRKAPRVDNPFSSGS